MTTCHLHQVPLLQIDEIRVYIRYVLNSLLNLLELLELLTLEVKEELELFLEHV